MKKMISVALGLALGMFAAFSQEIIYALPSTTLVLKVEVEQENFYAGPYASFAQKLLNLSVQDQDSVSSAITSIELIPTIEADMEAQYACDAENASLLTLCAQGLVSIPGPAANSIRWRFPALPKADFSSGLATEPEKTLTRVTYKRVITEEGDTLSVPVEHKSLVQKSLEDKAAEAASQLLAIRKDRLAIASGNTDASYSGEALSAALKELDRSEKQYMALFSGHTTVQHYSAVFEVTPDPTLPNQRYLAFRLTQEGPVAEAAKGTPFYLELDAPQKQEQEEETPERKKSRGPLIHYRIPGISHVRLTEDGRQLLETRVPIYQFGRESTYPTQK